MDEIWIFLVFHYFLEISWGQALFYFTFTSSHKLILFLSYFVYCGYTDDVDRNYIVYTEKKVEARSFLNTI